MARVNASERSERVHILERKRDDLPAQSLVRGLQILRVFKPGEGSLSHSEIVDRTQLPKSTVSRLTQTLTASGYLWYSSKLGRYALGPAVVALCHMALTSMPYREHARPILKTLADRYRLPVSLGARDQLTMINLDTVRHAGAPSARFDIGACIPIETTAMGRACLYGMAASEREQVIEAVLEARERKQRDMVRRSLDDAFESLETRGFCCSFGDWRIDVWGVGASVVAPEGPPLAINCGGHPNDLSRDLLENELGPRVASAAITLNGAPLF